MNSPAERMMSFNATGVKHSAFKHVSNCVRCGLQHGLSACVKDVHPVKCVTFGGYHTASYKGCVVYQQVENRWKSVTSIAEPFPNRQIFGQTLWQQQRPQQQLSNSLPPNNRDAAQSNWSTTSNGSLKSKCSCNRTKIFRSSSLRLISCFKLWCLWCELPQNCYHKFLLKLLKRSMSFSQPMKHNHESNQPQQWCVERR